MRRRRGASALAGLAFVAVAGACSSFGSSSGDAPGGNDAQADVTPATDGGVDAVATDAATDAAPVVVVSGPVVNGVAASETTLYWTEQSGHVHRADLDGKNDAAFGPGNGNPTVIVIHKNGSVYWIEHGAAQRGLYKAALDGSGAAPVHALLDASAPNLDWLTATDNYLVTASASSAPSDGQLVWFDPQGNVAADAGGLNNPQGVAAADGNQVIWSESSSLDVYLAGPSAPRQATFATNLSDPRGVAYANGYGYWTRYNGNAIERAKPGGPIETLSGGAQPFGIAAAGGDAYWLEAGTGVLRRFREGGATTTIATGLTLTTINGQPPYGPQVAITSSWVFFVASTQILRLPR